MSKAKTIHLSDEVIKNLRIQAALQNKSLKKHIEDVLMEYCDIGLNEVSQLIKDNPKPPIMDETLYKTYPFLRKPQQKSPT